MALDPFMVLSFVYKRIGSEDRLTHTKTLSRTDGVGAKAEPLRDLGCMTGDSHSPIHARHCSAQKAPRGCSLFPSLPMAAAAMSRAPGGAELGPGGGGWSLDEPFAPSLGWFLTWDWKVTGLC